jgi:uncharacterized protein YjbI with pentapeptide repeats
VTESAWPVVSNSETIVVRDEFGEEVFRWEVPEGQSGFSGADLQGAVLDGAQLRGADFSGADLYWATFCDANLEDSSFRNACLRGAILQGARLRGSDLEGADLGLDKAGGSTDLQGADLRDCNLFRTNLEGAQYDERTRFPDHFFPKQAGLIFTSSVSVDGD